MAVERVLKLLRKGFDLESLGQKLFLEIEDLFSQVRDLLVLGLNDPEFTLVVPNLEFKKSYILKPLLVLNFTTRQSALKDLDFFVEQRQLVVPSDQLSSKDVSFVDDALVVLLQLFDFVVGFLDDVAQL